MYIQSIFRVFNYIQMNLYNDILMKPIPKRLINVPLYLPARICQLLNPVFEWTDVIKIFLHLLNMQYMYMRMSSCKVVSDYSLTPHFSAFSIRSGVVVVVIVWQLDLQLSVQSVDRESCEFKPRVWRYVLDTTLWDKMSQWLATGRAVMLRQSTKENPLKKRVFPFRFNTRENA